MPLHTSCESTTNMRFPMHKMWATWSRYKSSCSTRTQDVLHTSRAQEQLKGDDAEGGQRWPWLQLQKMQSSHYHGVGWAFGGDVNVILYTLYYTMVRHKNKTETNLQLLTLQQWLCSQLFLRCLSPMALGTQQKSASLALQSFSEEAEPWHLIERRRCQWPSEQRFHSVAIISYRTMLKVREWQQTISLKELQRKARCLYMLSFDQNLLEPTVREAIIAWRSMSPWWRSSMPFWTMLNLPKALLSTAEESDYEMRYCQWGEKIMGVHQ